MTQSQAGFARKRAIGTLFLATVLAACTGTITDAPDDERIWEPPEITFAEGVVDFECADATHTDAPLRRLSRVQLQNTLRDVMVELLGDSSAAVVPELMDAAEALPHDQRLGAVHGGQLLFDRADQTLGQGAVRAHHAIALRAGALLSSPTHLAAMGFECVTNADTSDDAECIDGLVRTVGMLTHRRPLADAEFEFYRRETYEGDSTDAGALEALITKLFLNPNLMFHVEGVGELNAYEAANRLSYHLWNTMPDEELRMAAESGELLTDEGWRDQVDRLVSDGRMESSVRSFLMQWLRFDDLVPASSGQGADFEAVAGDLGIDETFDAAVEDELVGLFLHVLRSGGTFEEFFLSEVTTTTHPVLAGIYGVEPAAEGAAVPVPESRRGILSRVGLLLARAEVAIPTINSITHPILRGVLVRRQIVCDDLQSAPGGAMDDLPIVDRTTTGSREATEILTGTTACSGCHGRINPSGYVLESFDAVGQERTEERLFNADGEETLRLPIDTFATLAEAPDGVDNAGDLAQRLYDSEKVGACFARHYLRFTLGRSEILDANADGCALRAIDEAIDEGLPLREVLTQTVLDPAYRNRTEPGEL